MRTLALFAVLGLAGCGEETGHDPDHEHGGAAHGHYSRHGGMVLEIGDHLAWIDLRLDPDAGTLAGWMLDFHSDAPPRLAAEEIRVRATVDGKTVVLALKAQADALSGETVGDTSHFLGTDPALKGAKELRGTIEKINVYGQDFTGLEFTYAPDHTDGVR